MSALGLVAAAGAARANVMFVYEYSSSTVTVTTLSLLCHDAASAMIPGMPPVGVVDGHPSIAELDRSDQPGDGDAVVEGEGDTRTARAKKWTATIALAGVPNPFAPPKATASVWNEVVVTSTTTTVTTATIHIRIIPERPMCLYDPGVLGAEMMNYSVYDSRFAAPIWQKNIMFTGTEAGPTREGRNDMDADRADRPRRVRALCARVRDAGQLLRHLLPGGCAADADAESAVRV
jgi:hypothetical protein